MIFRDVSLEEWLERYPELEIEEGFCNQCGKTMRTTKPFVEKGYVGLVSPKCSCGLNTNQVMTVLPTSYEEIGFWNSFVGY